MSKKPAILVIDDEKEVGTFFEFYFKEEKEIPISVANNGNEARILFKQKSFDLALVDLMLPDTDGISLLKEIKESNSGCEVIIMTGYSTVKSAVEAIKFGALDYIEKPFDELEELDRIIEQALKQIYDRSYYIDREVEKLASDFGIIMAKDSPLQELIRLGKKVATRKISVLIEGDTGTGKEVLARFIHANSARAEFPFIGVNCGALTETLLESELFGHEKGAFTGAQASRHGIFEVAHKGTLFLDEIGEASPAIQVKLLRVLESGEFFRVGGEKPVKTDVRIIAATNKNLHQAVTENLFREDLFYRLNVVSLYIPPLCERPMDILPLIKYLIKKNLPEEEKSLTIEYDFRALKLLKNYHWPGNIRELSNVVARSIALRTGDVMGPECLPGHINLQNRDELLEPQQDQDLKIEELVTLYSKELLKKLLIKESIDLTELSEVLKRASGKILKEIIEKTLEKTNGNRAEAAKMLNLTPRTMRYLQNEKVK
jgi:two-component system NtrC family response regulator